MQPNTKRNARGRRAAGTGSQQPQQLSAIAGSALQGTRRNITTLWKAFAKQLPTIRNATQYYAHDVQRLGRTVYEAAAALQQRRQLVSEDEPDSAAHFHAAPRQNESSSDPLADAHFEVEAHYSPASLDELGVEVQRSELQRVPGLGLVLVLCIEGGFAIFAVDHDGVFEVAVALASSERGAVIAVKMVSASRAVVATSDNLFLYDVQQQEYVRDVAVALPGKASNVLAMDKHVVVLSEEYSQVFVFKVDANSLVEAKGVFPDRPVIAASQRWLAYCAATPKVATTTAVHSTRVDTVATSLAKTVTDGWSSLTGGLGLGSQASGGGATLGAVTLFDVESARDFASFIAHDNHLQCMAFDGSGTMLATASVSGTTAKVFQVMPGPGFGGAGSGSRPTATVRLLFNLQRGMTAGTVTSLAFSPLNAWAGLATSVGTVHCYAIPTAQRHFAGASTPGSERYAAPTLTAACRLRSAPMSRPVNPMIAFHADVDLRANRAAVYAASASGTVGGVVVSEQGALLAHQQHLTEFSAGAEEDVDTDGAPSESGEAGGASSSGALAADKDAGDEHQQQTADSVWRSAVELRPHPKFPKLKNCRFVDFSQPQQGAGVDGGGQRVAVPDKGASQSKQGAAAKAAADAPATAAVAGVYDEWEEA